MAVFTGTKEKDQAERRRPIILRDQYGRKWESTLDTDAMGTCAPINPKGWVDILNTPVRFKKEEKNEDGNLVLNIRVDEWIAYLEQEHAKYDQKLYADAMMLFGTEGPEAYDQRKPALINYTGPAPQPLEPIYALKDGNSWILGKTTTPDPRLVKYFAKHVRPRPSFKDEDLVEQVEQLEEQHDPDALGGKVQKVGKGRRALAEEAA